MIRSGNEPSTPSGNDSADPARYPKDFPWNDTSLELNADRCIHNLITDQVARTPDAVALRFEGRDLTYAELDRRSNQLAHFLHQAGVRPGTLVGLSTFRSFEMVIGLLGILKAGGAYVPLDPEYPRDRLEFMLGDTDASVLLTQERVASHLPAHGGRTVCLDSGWAEIAKFPETAVTSNVTPGDLAYMIYTSGSTGKPKGALNGHRGVSNRLLWMQHRYQIGPGVHVLQKTPFSFDVSVWEFFWPLMVGAKLIIAKPGGHQDPAYLADFIRREAIHVLHFVPSMLRAFLDEPTVSTCTSLRHVVCSGEALTFDLQQKFFQLFSCELHNLYGPTEAAVDVTHWTCDRSSKSEIVPIGRPVANTRIHILDPQLREVPVGESGELHIGGVQVGKGYHKRPELTAEKFIADPFSNDPEARLYKTGDLARWLPDGTVDYLGRIDFQVKIRGFRIELGEIESLLAQHEAIHQAVVVAKRQPGSDDRLVGYVSPRGTVRPSATELRQHLLARVPDYMVPAQFCWLDQIPLSPNGKVDRKALPEPSRGRPDLAAAFAAPHSDLENRLATLWAELLNLEQVGIDDSFFELGGTSLLAVRFTSQWRKLNGTEIPIVKVFQFPTISGLSRWLEAKANPAKKTLGSARPRTSSKGVVGQDPVAIVSIACRLPGAETTEQFWDNLRNGVESITVFDRKDLGPGIDESLRNDPDYIPARGILEGAELFDAAFFGIGAMEATVMDPQQRVFLELAYHALERAGYDPDRCPGPVGVFAGVGDNHYHTTNLLAHPDLLKRVGKLAIEYGNEKDYIALRVAYTLGLTGPAVSANTGCSTSLLAVDHAVRALSLGECDLALAGGVDIFVPQRSGFLYQEGGTFAKDGHCRPFDAEATGTMFCDGAGLVVLKRLDDALADGDTIHAVIRGTAKNNNGSRTVSFLAPSVEGQAEVIALAQANAKVPVETIGYVEAHGTGTPVGDPIEIEALNQVFNAATDKRQFSYLGSHKGNVGHPTIAAGITGLIKAALVLEKEEIPATLHFKTLNPKIDLSNSAFRIADRLLPFPRTSTPRRTAVSSFGFGGTNVHVILEEAPLPRPSGPSRAHQLLVLSAKTSTALARQAKDLASFLSAASAPPLADVAFTLSKGRKAWPHRSFVIAEDHASASRQWSAPLTAHHCQRRGARSAFLFSSANTNGKLSGAELYRDEPLLRALMDEGLALATTVLGKDARALFLGDHRALTPLEREALHFAITVGISNGWKGLGVAPATFGVTGTGLWAALALAGVVETTDALVLLRAHWLATSPEATGTEKETWQRLLASTTFSAPTVPIFHASGSAVTLPLSTELILENDAADQVLQALKELKHEVFLDCSNGDSWARAAAATPAFRSLHLIPSLGHEAGEVAAWLQALGRLWLQGVDVDWDAFYGAEDRRRVRLPTYPFEHQRFWVEPVRSVSNNQLQTAALPSVPASVPVAAPTGASVQQRLLGLLSPICGKPAHEIDLQATFLEQGFDSLTLVQVSGALRSEFQARISFNQLMGEFPNVALLVTHLGGKAEASTPATPAARPTTPTVPAPAAVAQSEAPAKAPKPVEGESQNPFFGAPAQLQDLLAENKESTTAPATADARALVSFVRTNPSFRSAVNEALSLQLSGRIDADAVARALQSLSDRHDALRSHFPKDGTALTLRPPGLPIPCLTFDFRDLTESERQVVRAKTLTDESERSFALESGPLFRASLLLLTADRAELLLTVHGAICDGWSLDVLVHDFASFYSAELSGRPASLNPVPSYSRYLSFANGRAGSEKFTHARAYWEHKYRFGFPALAFSRGDVSGGSGLANTGSLKAELSPAAYAALKSFAARQGSSFVGTVLSAFSLSLAHLSAQPRFVIALPSAEQPLLNQRFLVGNCANVLPFLVDLTPGQPLSQVLASTQAQLSELHGYAAFNAYHLLERLDVGSSLQQVHPLTVGITFLQHWKPEDLRQDGFKLHYDHLPKAAQLHQLFLSVNDTGSTIQLQVTFTLRALGNGQAATWLKSLMALLELFPDSASLAWDRLGTGALTTSSEASAQLYQLKDSSHGIQATKGSLASGLKQRVKKFVGMTSRAN